MTYNPKESYSTFTAWTENVTAPNDEEYVSFQEARYVTIIYYVIGSLGMLGNGLVLVVIFNYTLMRKRLTTYFIINQSLIDFFVALFLVAGILGSHSGHGLKGSSGEALCRLWLTRLPLWSLLTSSNYNLVAVSLERYFEVVHPIPHKLYFTHTKAYIGMVCVWLSGFVYNIVWIVPTSGLKDGVCVLLGFWPSYTAQRVSGIAGVIFQFIIPLIILVFSYANMAFALRSKDSQPETSQPIPASHNQQNQVQVQHQQGHQPPAATITPTSALRSKAKANVIKTLAIVSGCFVLCWSGNQFYFLLINLGILMPDFTSSFYHFSVVIMFANCCVNPFIYTAKYKAFQRGLLLVIGKKPATVVPVNTATNSTW